MDEPTNEDRAASAQLPLSVFAEQHGEPDQREDVMSDLISNILHAAVSEGLDADRVARCAIGNFMSERGPALYGSHWPVITIEPVRASPTERPKRQTQKATIKDTGRHLDVIG